MKRFLFLGILLLVCFLTVVLANSFTSSVVVSQSTETKTFPCKANSTIYINRTIDLNGDVYILPANVTIVPGKGRIKNGTLVGQETKIKGLHPIFDRVRIQGSWNVEKISTSLFKTLDYDNSLADVFALASASRYNDITIPSGKYYVTATAFKSSLGLPSNTTLTLDGEIILRPNDFEGYYILSLGHGENISVKGHGAIIGDKTYHHGSKGEWGHGINIMNGRHVSIEGILIKDCWGDCIYIGERSQDVDIAHCRIVNGRRQGISITSADKVNISDCTFQSVNGTAPEYAIDLEPNANDTVQNIIISRNNIDRCTGGIIAYTGRSATTIISHVQVSDCTISNCSKPTVYIAYARNMSVDRCTFSNTNNQYVFFINHPSATTISNNVIIDADYVFSSTEGLLLNNNIIKKGKVHP